MPRTALAALALVVLAAAPAAAAVTPRAPATVTVGSPAQPGALAKAVQDAYAAGARRIVIRPGTYFLPDVGHSAFRLDGWKDATVSAYGVTLILTDLAWTHDGFDLEHCTRVTVAGPTLSQNKVTAYQGRVLAVGSDDAGQAYADWRPDAGYPAPPAGPAADTAKFFGNINVLDAQTRVLKVGVPDMGAASVEARGSGTFRLHFREARLRFGAGDWLVGRHGDAPFKVYLGDCRGCTVRDVTLMRNGFAPLREDGGGGNRYLHCAWSLGPRPQGATQEPLVTNAADGMHMIGSYPGPDIERCVFRGVFLDDCIAIHGGFKTIKSGAGDAFTCDGDAGPAAVGQAVRISDRKGFFAQATVTAIKDNGDNTATVTLDRAVDAPAGSKYSNPLRDGAGYRIIGCRLGDTRSRGILVKADGGLIKDNVIEGCGLPAISIGPEYSWGEADYAQNVVVEGNTLRGNGRQGYGGGAVFVHGDGAVGNKDIVVRDNRFSSNYQGDIDVAWTDGVTLSGNTLAGAGAWPDAIRRQSAVLLANSRRVALRRNTVVNPSAYKPALVAVGPDVTGLTGSDPSGIRLAATKTEATRTEATP